MSYWTYIQGTIVVSPMGRTQAEKTYILNTVLDHLPNVTGSERDMHVTFMQMPGTNNSSSCDEFGMRTNNLRTRYGNRSYKNGWLEAQEDYMLIVNGSLRDREFDQTYKEFMNWICRLAKRIDIWNVLVRIKGYGKEKIINYSDYNNPFLQMFEDTSWVKRRNGEEHPEPNWCEYLMWNRGKNTDLPALLAYKYYADDENDKYVESILKGE